MFSSPQRLVIDGRRLNGHRTGVGRYLETLLGEWAATGLPASEVIVVLSDQSGLERVPIVHGLAARVVVPKLPGLLWERFGLTRVLRPGDLLFAPTNLISWGWRGRTVLVMFDALQEARPDDFSRLTRIRFAARYRKALARADRVIVPSRATARDLSRIYGVSETRLRVILPAADRSFRPLAPEHPDIAAARAELGLLASPFFLFVGKKSRRRNVPQVVRAFEELGLEDHTLVFVGDPARPFARAKDERRRILDVGHVSEATLRGLMASATALLYPTEHEGFGLPIVEAMAMGCPVIALHRESVLEAGGDGPYYLASADSDSLADAMKLLATDELARELRVEKGLAAAGRHSIEKFAADVRAVLHSLLG